MTETDAGRDRDHLVLAELERLAGVRDERRDVGAEEVLALAEADDQRRVVPGADDDVGRVLVHGEQRERAVQRARDLASSPR